MQSEIGKKDDGVANLPSTRWEFKPCHCFNKRAFAVVVYNMEVLRSYLKKIRGSFFAREVKELKILRDRFPAGVWIFLILTAFYCRLADWILAQRCELVNWIRSQLQVLSFCDPCKKCANLQKRASQAGTQLCRIWIYNWRVPASPLPRLGWKITHLLHMKLQSDLDLQNIAKGTTHPGVDCFDH